MSDPNNERPTPIEIPMTALSEDALAELIESFVLKEGTDYGATEVSLATKVRQIRTQLEREDIKIVFDAESESVTLLTKADFAKLKAGG